MAKVVYNCHKCGEEAEFNTDTVRQLLLNDRAERPSTYVVNCPYCGAKNSVTPNK